MYSLSVNEIEKFSARRGVDKKVVEEFLDTIGQDGSEEHALLNLYYDARLFSWNISTVKAIEAGIRLVYSNEATDSEDIYDGMITPLPGAPYSIWPRSNQY